MHPLKSSLRGVIERRVDMLEREFALLRERQDKADDRLAELDGLDRRVVEAEHQLRELRRDLGQLRGTVDRLLSVAMEQGAMLQKVHSLLEQLVRQQTPSVEVSRG